MTRSSRHLVDPELHDFLDAWPTVVLDPELLALVRARDLPIPVVDNPAAQAVVLEHHRASGPDGAPDIALRVYRPSNQSGPLPCIFHIHGGGFVAGDTDEIEAIHRARVADLGCVLTTLDYRLAPETRFPGNIEDCYATLAWVFRNAGALRIDTSRLGVVGESAGGGLAAALALLARDRGEYRLAFQHLIYPMLDDRTCATSDPHPYAGEFIWTPHNNAFGWSALLGVEPGSPGVSPYAAAARAENLEGLPPTFVSTGALDLFVDEDIDYVRRLNRAGVPVEFHLYPGGFHGYDLHPTARVATQARADSRAALQRFLSGEPAQVL
ncbi:MAG TPA: alpha/beta hydrolase [Caulobacteraceae bacterium]|jgi:triacylglycerol lipase|nr:alpha/beta hydrolase [Caulobacteraceae bacterium]